VGVLGFSKRIGELLVRHQASSSGVFCSVRFGNVVGSRGSALPEFIRQIDAGGPVTVTHPDVERYFMTIPEAVSLVLQAGTLARGGELFMLHMGTPVKIVDLVHRIIRMRGLRIGKDVDVVFTGLRPGEKLKEELLFEVERTRPTANPSIYAVEDALSAEVSARLDDGVAMLEQIAAQGDPEQIRAALARLAQGLAPDEPARLRSIG
jgi:FlaA1/EpsC-like NDP-sugar epimerase